VGLEILGRLLYYTYDKDPEGFAFDEEKISAITRLDWSRQGKLWQNNVVSPNIDPNSNSDILHTPS